MPGLVPSGVFGNDPIAAETLFKGGGTRDLRSRGDLVAVMESGPKLNLQDPVEFPSLESSVASLRDLKVNESTRTAKRRDGSSMEAGSGDAGTTGTPTLAPQMSTASTVCGVPAHSQEDMLRLKDYVDEPPEPEEVLGGITGPRFDEGFKRPLEPTPSWPWVIDDDVYRAHRETARARWENDVTDSD
jgi:hypothetical protein